MGTSGDYAPFSFSSEAAPGGLDGFDVALARAFAATEGRPLELVRFHWPELETALREGRFEVVMSGVTVRADRSLTGRFSVPVAESGAVALVRDPTRFPELGALERGPAQIVVNAGGHLERVARLQFPQAHIEALADNAQVRRTLREGRADAAVTDTLEARGWQQGAEKLRILGPFSRDRKAPLVRADQPELAARLDSFLLAREADGTLAELRRTWLGADHAAPTATPLRALLAAADERLALMPLVAEAKRRAGKPITDSAQEARVLDAGVRAVHEEAVRTGRPKAPDAAVRPVFEALIAAARDLEQLTLLAPSAADAEASFDLDTALRPAVGRITPRIAAALVRLQDLPPVDVLHKTVREELHTPGVPDADTAALADALASYVRATRASAAPAGELPPGSP